MQTPRVMGSVVGGPSSQPPPKQDIQALYEKMKLQNLELTNAQRSLLEGHQARKKDSKTIISLRKQLEQAQAMQSSSPCNTTRFTELPELGQESSETSEHLESFSMLDRALGMSETPRDEPLPVDDLENKLAALEQTLREERAQAATAQSELRGSLMAEVENEKKAHSASVARFKKEIRQKELALEDKEEQVRILKEDLDQAQRDLELLAMETDDDDCPAPVVSVDDAVDDFFDGN